jgi:hypothetical protein
MIAAQRIEFAMRIPMAVSRFMLAPYRVLEVEFIAGSGKTHLFDFFGFGFEAFPVRFRLAHFLSPSRQRRSLTMCTSYPVARQRSTHALELVQITMGFSRF